jgi:hypothetical protein
MPRDEAAAVLPFKLRPSRQFALEQATLTALHDCFPIAIATLGMAAVGSSLLTVMNDHFVWCVRRNFHEMATRYDLQGL